MPIWGLCVEYQCFVLKVRFLAIKKGFFRFDENFLSDVVRDGDKAMPADG